VSAIDLRGLVEEVAHPAEQRRLQLDLRPQRRAGQVVDLQGAVNLGGFIPDQFWLEPGRVKGSGQPAPDQETLFRRQVFVAVRKKPHHLSVVEG